jgi:nucleoid-associated protein YgaU
MLTQTASIWAASTGAAVLVGGAAAAVYLERPDFLWPTPAPAAVVAPAAAVAAASAPASDVSAKAAPLPLPAVAALPASVKPSFDVVSVEPSGEAVIAGRAAPNAKVALEDAGKVVAEATANSDGQFVIIPPALPPGDHKLALSAGVGASAQTSNAISVAVAEPPPAQAAAEPPPRAQSTASPVGAVAVKSVEASAGGRLVAKGAAAPNAVVRLYLSGSFVGDAKAAGDGRWSLTIEHGMTPGGYSMRADEIDPADAKVVARAETPFTYPATAAAPAPAESQAAPTTPGELVVDSVQTHHVEMGHTLWAISQKFYGDGSRYQAIFAANSGQIKDPHWIFPGQTFVVPKGVPNP